MKRLENWIQDERKKNKLSTCRSRAYYVSVGQKLIWWKLFTAPNNHQVDPISHFEAPCWTFLDFACCRALQTGTVCPLHCQAGIDLNNSLEATGTLAHCLQRCTNADLPNANRLECQLLVPKILCPNKMGSKKTFPMDSLAFRGDFYQKQDLVFSVKLQLCLGL